MEELKKIKELLKSKHGWDNLFFQNDMQDELMTDTIDCVKQITKEQHKEEVKESLRKFLYFIKAKGIVIEEEHKPQDFEFLYSVWSGENPDGLNY